MRLQSKKAKVEKVASRDQSRPVLTRLYLRVEQDGDERRGWLEATDSYKAVRIPVDVDPDDVEGYVTTEALVEARKRSRHLSYVEMGANGSLDVGQGSDAVSFHRPDDGSKWAAIPELFPAVETEFVIGLNARFLLDLAEAFGGTDVQIRFCATDEGAPNPLRPMVVRPLRSDVPDAVGLLMPIRVGG